MSDFIVFKIIYPLLGILMIILNPLSIFGLAILISIIFYLIFFGRNLCIKIFLFVFAAFYFLFLMIYSLSPKIQYIEFKYSHFKWIEVDGKISDFAVDWKGSKSRKSGVDIKYQFFYDHKTYSGMQKNVIQHYTNSVFWDSDKEIKQSNQTLSSDMKDYISEKNYKIYYKAETGESKVLMPLNNFLLSNSFAFNILFALSKIIFIPLLVIFLISKAFSENRSLR